MFDASQYSLASSKPSNVFSSVYSPDMEFSFQTCGEQLVHLDVLPVEGQPADAVGRVHLPVDRHCPKMKQALRKTLKIAFDEHAKHPFSLDPDFIELNH